MEEVFLDIARGGVDEPPRGAAAEEVVSTAAATAMAGQSGIGASLRRVRALLRRHTYLLLRSWTRLVSMVYYPTVTMVLWAFLTLYLAPTNIS